MGDLFGRTSPLKSQLLAAGTPNAYTEGHSTPSVGGSSKKTLHAFVVQRPSNVQSQLKKLCFIPIPVVPKQKNKKVLFLPISAPFSTKWLGHRGFKMRYGFTGLFSSPDTKLKMNRRFFEYFCGPFEVLYFAKHFVTRFFLYSISASETSQNVFYH